MDKIWAESYSAQELYTGHLIIPYNHPKTLYLQNQLSTHLITPVTQDPPSVTTHTFSQWEPGTVSQCGAAVRILGPCTGPPEPNWP
ncbi:unnamed protein product [Leuciscus chuanchicus]